MVTMTGFSIIPRGPFSLAAAQGFLAGFPPALYTWSDAAERLRLGFPLDGSGEAVAVSLHERAGVLYGEVAGTDNVEAARRQAARILSLDHDGSGYPEVGRRDPIVGRLQELFPGFRPVCFTSPYEAAAWAILSNRMRMTQAAQIKMRLVTEHGTSVVVDGETVPVFPAPPRLLQLQSFPGLSEEKIVRLHGLAEAALDGRLDADRLRQMPVDAALAELQTLRGIGEWGAQHILMRGAGPADTLPTVEMRVRQAVARAYRLSTVPDDIAFARIAEAWRPYRMWVCVLLRVGASWSSR